MGFLLQRYTCSRYTPAAFTRRPSILHWLTNYVRSNPECKSLHKGIEHLHIARFYTPATILVPL
jgi:hypothetical protein